MKKLSSILPNTAGKAGRFLSAILCSALLLMSARAFAAPPANDNFANAIVISAAPPATVVGNNTEATYESGEPVSSVEVPPADAGTNTVWWIWTPSSSGAVTIDTVNSSFDTELGVYTGSSVNALAAVARNDDDPGLIGGRSRLTLNTVAGTIYHIAVAGYQNIAGTINLNFSTGTTNPTTGFTLTANVTGSGTVAKNPNKASYDTNETVILTANPTGTNTFLGWGGDAAVFGVTNPITLTMDGNKTVSASFTTNAGGGTTFVLTINRLPTSSSGTVTRSPNKARYDAGEVVTVVARPLGSRTFVGWAGTDEASTDRTNTVTMTSDKTITATFSGVSGPLPSPYLKVVGTYTGLFYQTNGITQDCSGYFAIKVAKSGKFTGKFISGGKTFTTKGQIDTNGDATATVGRGTNSANLQFHVDLSGTSDKITGLVTADCVAQLSGDRQRFGARNPAPLAGKYTLILPRGRTELTNIVTFDGTNFHTNTVTTVIPNPVNGNGFAFLTINRAGIAILRGELADGTRISRTTAISKDGQIPVYVSLYKGDGSLIGWLNVTTAEASGKLSWIKPGPGGFEVDLEAGGSAFNPANKPFLTLANGVVLIGGDGLAAPIVEPVTLVRNTSFAVTGANANHLTLQLSSSGSLVGNFVNPATGKRTPLRGIVLTNSNRAGGYFLSPNGSGYFEVRNEP